MHDLIAQLNQLKETEMAFDRYKRVVKDAEYDLTEHLRLLRIRLEIQIDEVETNMEKETGGK